MQGYGKRFGANLCRRVYRDDAWRRFLPSLFKQDPRYFYKGTGSIPSRDDVRDCQCGHLQRR